MRNLRSVFVRSAAQFACLRGVQRHAGVITITTTIAVVSVHVTIVDTSTARR
ncbi:hypothetical protein [Burkholderia territorii]|uniref:hypothetical protein n=1 Tax=Burkholderia territorii TaxID=1503055 RepID=UPI0012D99432|nr:hypothetical protein [Burkholderia territorii]